MTTLIQYQIDEIKTELEELVNQTGPLVDIRMAEKILRQLNHLVETGGFPEFTISDVRFTDPLQSKHLNDMQNQIHKVMTVSRDVLEEMTDKFNTVLDKFTTAINKSSQMIETSTSSIDNIEEQVKERSTNASIHTHELKVINFNFNYKENISNIIADHTMTLPIVSKKTLALTPSLKVVQPSNAMITKLNDMEDVRDKDLFRGSFIGRLIAPLDSIRWGRDYGLSNAFDGSSNTDFIVQTIGWQAESQVDIMVKMPRLHSANIITIDTNASRTHVDFLGGTTTLTVVPRNGLIIGDRKTNALNFRLRNEFVTYPTYNVLKLKERESKETVSILNFSETLEAMNLAKEIFGPNQIVVDVGDSDLEEVEKKAIPVVETIVDNISVTEAIFGTNTLWQSNAIKTEDNIISVEINAETTVPDS